MLELKNISFAYRQNAIIENISFSVPKGQNTAIIGESGCGKSTLLKLIYGLYDLNEGKIFYKNKPILGPKHNLIPGEDYIKYLAQDFDLMPYITVGENVGKFLSNINKDRKNARILELLNMVEMTAFINVKAQYLSGGQQQRVALAKVLALEPEIILLDEPFSQIDSFRKNSLRRNLFNYLKEKQITCVIATHDSTDVLSFSDKTIVMKEGKIVANDNPKLLFENPKSKYIASLFCEVSEISTHLLEPSTDLNKKKLVYPHQLEIVKKSNLEVVIKKTYFRGNHYLIESVSNNETIFFENKTDLEIGLKVCLAFCNDFNRS